MIDLLIFRLVLLPFLTADIQLHSGDCEAWASEGLTGPSICHAAIRTMRQRRDKMRLPFQVLSY